MLKIWDFILARDDGSSASLHPQFSCTKFPCKFSEPEMDHEVPRAGRGRTDGPGTYKLYKTKQMDAKLQFDKKKCAANGQPQTPNYTVEPPEEPTAVAEAHPKML